MCATRTDAISGCEGVGVWGKLRNYRPGRFGVPEIQGRDFVLVLVGLVRRPDCHIAISQMARADESRLMPADAKMRSRRHRSRTLAEIRDRLCALAECGRPAQSVAKVNTLKVCDIYLITYAIKTIKAWHPKTALIFRADLESVPLDGPILRIGIRRQKGNVVSVSSLLFCLLLLVGCAT